MKSFFQAVLSLSMVICLVTPLLLSGQNDFRAIDRHALKAPPELHQDLPGLTAYLVEPARNDEERVRAIYVWITHNIGYDEEAYRNGVNRINRNNADILRRRRAVCFGYALLFQAMCSEAGVRAEVISGYSKGALTSRPHLEEADHAWNAVEIAGRWHLLDATWGSSQIDQANVFVLNGADLYFFAPPDRFIHTHLPNLPMWQLLDCPVTPAVFSQQADSIRHYLSSCQSVYHHADSIRHFLVMENPQRRLWEAEGAYRFNPTEANRENLGHSLIDLAGFRSEQGEGLQEHSRTLDSLINHQSEIIRLCRRAFGLMTPYDWQKELYINTLINQAVAFYRKADEVSSPTSLYDQALEHLSVSESLLAQMPAGSYFPTYARRQCQNIRSVIEQALKH